jgi:hypothetical protein
MQNRSTLVGRCRYTIESRSTFLSWIAGPSHMIVGG